ncbi:hypothetical protein BpHYR1_041509 [Brachionus plicatilis]|uniref:Uncharacterized protein n=1 Tax=Brachionus plicatilis TaxID=10195 RepID=A0A3M7T069_BRAPC|nr:hypothetical protein BpHYR1_041509 [Brachionus plicatilis]
MNRSDWLRFLIAHLNFVAAFGFLGTCYVFLHRSNRLRPAVFELLAPLADPLAPHYFCHSLYFLQYLL